MEKKPNKRKTSKELFEDKYKDFKNDDLLKEILFYQIRNDKTHELVRQNTSKLVWWLIAIPILLGLLYVLINLIP